MPDSSNTPEVYERVVKIKELPIKESITPDSVLLIEDDQDTKQMSVKAFYDLIDNMSAQALSIVKAKMEEVDSLIKLSGIEEAAEIMKQLQESEEQRKQAEIDRQNTFNGWKNTVENTWTPSMEDAILKESERQSNETYRTNKFNEWLQMINQWETAEQNRVKAEDDRESAETQRQNNETSRGTEFTNKITEINNLILSVNQAITNMEDRFEDIKDQIESGADIQLTSPPVGTTMLATSSTTTFFNECFGGTWEIVGHIDGTIEGSGTITLYMFKKISD